MASKQPLFSQRFLGFLSSFFALIVFSIGGFFLLEKGDGPADWPTFHAGGLILFSDLFVLGFGLISPVSPPKTTRWVPLLLAVWTALGAATLIVIELWSNGQCCSNPNIHQVINFFTIGWPTLFTIVTLRILRHNSGRLAQHLE